MEKEKLVSLSDDELEQRLVSAAGHVLEISSERLRRRNVTTEDDYVSAFRLLAGVVTKTKRPALHYLSSRTDPTEKEARTALSRILLSGDVPTWLLYILAIHFSPEMETSIPYRLISPRKIKFANKNQGNKQGRANYLLAMQVALMQEQGLTIADAAERFGLTERQVQRICREWREDNATRH
jgi:hypothetical protein